MPSPGNDPVPTTRHGDRNKLHRLCLCLAGVLTLVVAAAYAWLHSTLPDYERELTSAALADTTVITRDPEGVPHIQAQSFRDAVVAMGYVQAQDRFWQLFVMRRAVQGRLAEVFGSGLLTTDLNYRVRFQLPKIARRSLERLDVKTRSLFQAFADGVNLAVQEGEAFRSPEWALSGVNPEPWTASDVNNVFTVFSSTASGGERELWLAQLDDAVPAPIREAVLRPLPAAYPTLYGSRYGGPPLGAPDGARPSGTNFFLFGPRRTDSGAPILAVDPHLPLQAPSLIYPVRVSLPNDQLAGGAWVGTPAIAFGQNRYIAWGMTHLFADTVDYVVERVNPNSPEEYLTPSGSEAFEEHTEVFEVRGGAPQAVNVRYTRNGVVVSDAFEIAADKSRGTSVHLDLLQQRFGEGHVLVRKDAASREGLNTIGAVVELSRAHSISELQEALRRYEWTNNVAFADKQGNIGVQMAARIPRRRPVNGWDGQRPARAWLGEGRWDGFVPFDDLPTILNPPAGAIADSNSRAVGPDNPFRVGDSFAPPWRVIRATHLMAQRDRHTLDSIAAMQLDVYSEAAAHLIPRLEALPVTSPVARNLLQILGDWDRTMSLDAPEPLLYAAIAAALQERLINVWGPSLGKRHTQALVIARILDSGGDVCDHPATERQEDCTAAVTEAIERAYAVLSEQHGPETEKWRWRDEHKAAFAAIYSWDNLPWLGTRLRSKVDTPGGLSVINQGAMARTGVPRDDLLANLNFDHTHGAAFRFIADLDDKSNSRWAFAPGVSGNIVSRHWADQANRWASGAYGAAFLEPNIVTKTILRPAKPLR